MKVYHLILFAAKAFTSAQFGFNLVYIDPEYILNDDN